MMMQKLSIIVPCFNEEKALPHFLKETKKIAEMLINSVNIEFILIDDGSRDNTSQIIINEAMENKDIKYIIFSRNFGKESAIWAGFQNTDADYIVVMDADLQDPPHLLPEMLSALQNNHYDAIGTRRVDRKGEPPIRSYFARLFYKLIRKISTTDIVDGARDFKMVNKKYANAIRSITEYHRFSKGIFGWVGYRTKWLEYENCPRVDGETKWSFWKLFWYAIEGIISFSTAPLRIASFLGLFISIATAMLTLFYITKTLVWHDPVAGFPTLISVILFLGGVQLLTIGIIGEYVGKTYMEVKRRPHYLIQDTNIKKAY